MIIKDFDENDWDSSLEFYMKNIKQSSCINSYSNENLASDLYNVSVCYLKKGKYEKSIYYLKKALKLNIDAKYFFNIAWCYVALNNHVKALMYFNQAWALNNNDNACYQAIKLLLKRLSANPHIPVSTKTIFTAIYKEKYGFEIIKYLIPANIKTPIQEELIKFFPCKRKNTKKFFKLVEKIQKDFSIEKFILL